MVHRFLFAAASLALASVAQAQLVPLARCNGAIPCNIPFGLRPADAAAWSPYAKPGQSGVAISVSAGVEEGLKPKIDTRAASDDPSERAARIFVKHYPPPTTPAATSVSTAAPTPSPTPRASRPPEADPRQ